MKISGSEIKQVNRFTYLESMEEENGKIQNEINERIRKVSKFYHLIKSTL
jgi:Asp-tRNA(Asn)/Glu-tRNA(Gln) amidotransferase C subunit